MLMRIFLYMDNVIRPWTPTPKAIFDSGFYWKLGYNTSL